MRRTFINTAIRTLLILVIGCGFVSHKALSQTFDLRGQAMTWIASAERSGAWWGLRYIPELSADQRISQTVFVDAALSVDGFGQAAAYPTLSDVDWTSNLKLYRFWARLALPRLDIRLGLQKINFGSAAMLRPLMWFDRMDPRDPLQLTDGAYGLLVRYYFLNNANLWLWGLLGNNETKGWEFAPSVDSAPEFGGRVQIPTPRGEAALSFHRRWMDVEKGMDHLLGMAGISQEAAGLIHLIPMQDKVNETRIGFDGKWDVAIGVWIEAALTHHDLGPIPYRYQRAVTIGSDYTIGLGNGIHVMAEHLRFDLAKEAFGQGEGLTLTAAFLNYPLGLLDQATVMLYRDWDQSQWYRFIQWQRRYDRWSFYLMGFWNPDQFAIIPAQQESALFTGKGFQLMIVLNH